MSRRPATTDIDLVDRRIVLALQDGFPLSPRPYAEAAAALGLGETELIARLRGMIETRVLTRFGPFFDAAALGGAFCLCAMAVPEDRFDAVAEQVGAHAEVAHNYRRTHALNMWFVLATETDAEVAEVADRIEAETGLEVFRFPKEHEFHISFRVTS